jgi:hypothetical protein
MHVATGGDVVALVTTTVMSASYRRVARGGVRVVVRRA